MRINNRLTQCIQSIFLEMVNNLFCGTYAKNDVIPVTTVQSSTEVENKTVISNTNTTLEQLEKNEKH